MPRGDGGGTDGAGADMGGDTGMTIDAPPSLCPGPFLMCDPFESSMLDARWQLDNSMGSVAVDATRAYRGGSSLHSHVDAIGQTPVTSPRGSMRSYQGLPVTGTFYVRVFAYFPSTIPQRFVQFVNTTDDTGAGASVGMESRFVVNNDYSVPPSNFVPSTSRQMPLDRWVCVTYEVPSGTAGLLRIFVDGVEVSDTTIGAVAARPRPTHVYLGLDFPEMFAAQPAADAWFDEIVVDDAPVSCSD